MNASLRFLDLLSSKHPLVSSSSYDVMCLNYDLPSKWKDYILGGRLKVYVDGGFERVVAHCKEESIPTIYPDLVIGDFDSVDKNLLSQATLKGTKVIAAQDQDYHDFDKALTEYDKFIVNSKIKRVPSLVVLGALGGRRDQEYANIMAVIKRLSHGKGDNIQTIHLIGHEHISVICFPKGESKLILPESMVLPVGETKIGVFPSCGPSYVTTRGLGWDMSNKKLSMDSAISSSNYPRTSDLTINSSDPIIVTLSSKVL